MLNPVLLRTLTVVLRTSSFAEAARELGYTGSAVSQQIAALERSIRMQLFERSAHSIRPTPAAIMLAARSREVLAVLRALEDDLTEMAEGRTGHLSVGSFPTASARLMPAALGHFTSGHATVETSLDEGEADDLLDRVRDRDIDVAVVYRYDLVPRSRPQGLTVLPLLVEDLRLLLPEGHVLAGKDEPLSLEDLASETWIATNYGSPGASCMRHLCIDAGFEPHVVFRSNDYDVIHGFVEAGLGVALVPALSHEPRQGVLARSLKDVRAHRYVDIVHRAGNQNPVLPGFIDSLRWSVSDVLAEGLAPA